MQPSYHGGADEVTCFLVMTNCLSRSETAAESQVAAGGEARDSEGAACNSYAAARGLGGCSNDEREVQRGHDVRSGRAAINEEQIKVESRLVHSDYEQPTASFKIRRKANL